MKNGKRSFILTEIILGMLVVILAFFMLYNKNEDKTERIAVIIPDIEESQWSAFKYGLKMASQEYGVNTILISKSNINLSEDEMEVVKQEIDKLINLKSSEEDETLKITALKKFGSFTLSDTEYKALLGLTVEKDTEKSSDYVGGRKSCRNQKAIRYPGNRARSV